MLRPLSLLLLILCLSFAARAEDGDGRPRLVAGGMGRVQPMEMLSFGSTSFGTLNDVVTPNGVLSMGGYAAYAFNRPGEGQTALRLGYEWTLPGSDFFSLNPVHGGVSRMAQDGGGLSLSFTHELSPSLSLGGFAAAQTGEEHHEISALRLGAGVGVKF